MRNRCLFTCLAFLTLSTASLAQYQEFYRSERMEGSSPNLDGDIPGLEDPSFEFPFSARPSAEKIFVSKDFETNDFNAVQSLTRSWVGTPDEERVLGRKFLRINGTGCVANWFPIRPLIAFPDQPPSGPSLGHYVTVRAKQDGPFEAIFGINYFDANWKLLQKNSALISGSEAGVSRGDGDLLKKYTIPAHVPYGAVFGQVWIAAPFANGTTTFDFLNVFTEQRFSPNDWFNPDANLLRNSTPLGAGLDLVGSDTDFYKTGYEFWTAIPGSELGASLDFWKPLTGSGLFLERRKALLLGQPKSITNLYQVFDIQSNQPYAVRLTTQPRPGLLVANALPHARGWFGIDFFDSNAKKIDQVVFDITQGESIVEATYNPVANADFAIAWFYVEPLFRDEVLPIYEVDIHVPLVIPTAATAKAVSATTITASKTVKAKPKSSKVSAKIPASPITPAIALQAKNLLPSVGTSSVASKPTTK